MIGAENLGLGKGSKMKKSTRTENQKIMRWMYTAHILIVQYKYQYQLLVLVLLVLVLVQVSKSAVHYWY
jgi:hypothetical protein